MFNKSDQTHSTPTQIAVPPEPRADAVIAAEQAVIAPSDPELWGLALSGGGIRSATFALGVLQFLARARLLANFHYLSTVSGGGYVGAFVQGLIHRVGLPRALQVLASRPGDTQSDADKLARAQAFDSDLNRPIRHLREYSNYLSPAKSSLSGDNMGMIGTYVRNLILIQLQLAALLLVASTLPLVLFFVAREHLVATPAASLFLATMLAVLAAALLFSISDRARRAAAQQPAATTDSTLDQISLFFSSGVIVLLVLASIIGAFGIHGIEIKLTQLLPRNVLSAQLTWLSQNEASLAVAAATVYFAVWTLWIALQSLLERLIPNNRAQALTTYEKLRFLLASAVAAIVGGFLLTLLHKVMAQSWGGAETGDLWLVMTFGPTLMTIGVVTVATLHVGLAGSGMTDLQREIWARIGGKTTAVTIFAVTFSMSIVVFGPWLLTSLFARASEGSWVEISGALAWLLTSGGGVAAAHSDQTAIGSTSKQRTPGKLLDLLARAAPWLFALGVLMAVSLLAQWLLAQFAWSQVPAYEHLGYGNLASYMTTLMDEINQHAGATALFCIAIAAVWAFMGWAVDTNEFSLNAFYRNRLVRCYLGASNFKRAPEPITNFDTQDDVSLADTISDRSADSYNETTKGQSSDHPRSTAHGRPLYPLITAALNLVSAKQLDWQDRKAASFTLSPRYCGHLPPASRTAGNAVGDSAMDLEAQTGLAQTISLGKAIAISGAAVSPNMGAHSSPAVTFLLTLFDARLGWWIPNRIKNPSERTSPWFPGWQLLKELLGLTQSGTDYVYLSDGGHFENLALYELIRRRCRFILCVDSGADPDRSFSDLGNAIQKCRVDFGVNIDIDVSSLKPGANGRAQRHCAIGEIRYNDANKSIGVLLYLKPSLTGNEPADVTAYSAQHSTFPHEPTSDQFFDEAQFESYRQLGEHVARTAIDPALVKLGTLALDESDAGSLPLPTLVERERFILELKHRWTPPSLTVSNRFAHHAESIAKLFQQLRQDSRLAVLDGQMHTAWSQIAPNELDTGVITNRGFRQTQLPEPANFRACFYFCQELLQLMETVYIELDLDHSFAHPDNRGWMNTFRHWSWVPMLRVAWVLTMSNFGTRFVGFCQQHLGLPRIDSGGETGRSILELVDISLAVDQPVQEQLSEFARAGLINFIEQDVLRAAIGMVGHQETKIYALRLNWSRILDEVPAHFRNLTLGVALLSPTPRGRHLNVMRVQDHVRRLGIGTEFMRLLLRKHADVVEARVTPGDYGAAGAVTPRAAAALTEKLNELRMATRDLSTQLRAWPA